MQIITQDNHLIITSASPFSAHQTFTCGQCFRWKEQPDGSYLGIVRGVPTRAADSHGALVLSSDIQQYEQLWRAYFDCDTDYAAICDSFAVDAQHLDAASASCAKTLGKPCARLFSLNATTFRVSPALLTGCARCWANRSHSRSKRCTRFRCLNSWLFVQPKIWRRCEQATARHI